MRMVSLASVEYCLAAIVSRFADVSFVDCRSSSFRHFAATLTEGSSVDRSSKDPRDDEIPARRDLWHFQEKVPSPSFHAAEEI